MTFQEDGTNCRGDDRGSTRARLWCIGLFLMVFATGNALAQSPSYSNKRRLSQMEGKVVRPPGAPEQQGVTQAKGKCNVDPSRVQVGGFGSSDETRAAHNTKPFRPVSRKAHWRCDRPRLRAKEVWAGEPVVCEFEFLNDGATPLSVQARGG